MSRRILFMLVFVVLASCSRSSPEASHTGATQAEVIAPRASPQGVEARPGARERSQEAHAYERPAAERVMALGDLHGDLAATRQALRLVGALDTNDRWVGGKLVVVQTGDVLDRGDDDRAVVDLLEQVRVQAERAGGALYVLSGNHEVMNVAQDFRYVSERSGGDFADVGGRVAAFQPGGAYAKKLAAWPVVMKVGDTVFVHGGVLRAHVTYGLSRLNQEVAAWMRGERASQPDIMVSENAPVWSRLYSAAPDERACAELAEVLRMLSAKRMVVGHTPQAGGITSGCGGRVWRIDVGMSRFYGGTVQGLELKGDAVSVRASN